MRRVASWAGAHKFLAGIAGFLLAGVVIGAVNAATTGGKGINSGPAAAGAASSAPADAMPLPLTPSPPASSAAPASPSPVSAKTTAKPAPPTTSAAPEPTCDMTKEPDVIVRYKVPGLEDSAQELGGWDPGTCQIDIDSIMSTVPMGDGYCTWIAWKSDNPTYNPDAAPAPPLKHVLEAVGAGC